MSGSIYIWAPVLDEAAKLQLPLALLTIWRQVGRMTSLWNQRLDLLRKAFRLSTVELVDSLSFDQVAA